MDAVILAAGKGIRLLPYTKKYPKSLFKIKNKPIIEYIIKMLSEQKIKDVYIIVNYKKEKIIEFIENIKNKYHINPKFIYQKKLGGTAHALTYLPKNISNPFIVLLGDIIYGNFPKISSLKPTIFYKRSRDIFQKGIIETDKNKVNTIYYNKDVKEGEKLIDIGFYIFPRTVIDYCKFYNYTNQEVPITIIINNMIKNKELFMAQEFKGKLMHITSLKDSDINI